MNLRVTLARCGGINRTVGPSCDFGLGLMGDYPKCGMLSRVLVFRVQFRLTRPARRPVYFPGNRLSVPFSITPFLSFPRLSSPFLSFPFLPFHSLSFPSLSFPRLSSPFLSVLFLPRHSLPFPVLSFPFPSREASRGRGISREGLANLAEFAKFDPPLAAKGFGLLVLSIIF